MTPEDAKHMDAVRNKAQELLDTMFPDADYRLTVSVGRRDGRYDFSIPPPVFEPGKVHHHVIPLEFFE